uniref:Uncharacterized protein n=1 Tax=Arundo donax TaxID=35708 RepID=A0A0A9B2G3_ARUDO
MGGRTRVLGAADSSLLPLLALIHSRYPTNTQEATQEMQNCRGEQSQNKEMSPRTKNTAQVTST